MSGDGARLRVHAVLENSQANGPGRRAVIWLQGCSLGCPGCFNPQTHPAQGGEWVEVDELANRLATWQDNLEGLTISGGEPLQQTKALGALLRSVRRQTSLSVIVFTGFEEAELHRQPGIGDLLACVDVLISGRYRAEQRMARGLLGSANKRLLFLSGRYTPADFADLPEAELIIGVDGQVTFSGIDPLQA